jgi:YbbR domain-containing protein
VRELLAGLRASLGQNLGYKLVALFFATVLWVWVQSELRVTARARVEVAWKVPEGMALVEPPIEQLTAEIEGVQAFIRPLGQSRLSLVVDLSRASEGDVSVDLADRAILGLPSQLTVLSVSPAQVRVTLDRLLKRRVTVTPGSVGTVAQGFRLAGISVVPERAELSGASTVLRAMENVSTEDVDLGGLRGDADMVVGLALPKGIAAVGRTPSFMVHVAVEAVQTSRRFETVPVLIRDGDWTSPVTEVSVVLAGPEEALTALASDEVSVMVNLPQGQEGLTAEARRGRSKGARYEVVHGGGELVRVESVEPEVISLVRKE